MSTVSVIIPTYNERENIITLLKLLNERYKYKLDKIYVIDDNSPDNTAEAVKSMNYDNVHVIIRKNERGLGSALYLGLKLSLEEGFEYTVTMDADLSHDPKYLGGMLNKATAEKYDLVIGSRYIKGGGIENWSLLRRITSKGANTIVRLLFRSPLHDNTSNYRVYSREAVRVALECNEAGGYEFQICSVVKILKRGLKVSEYPIIFRNRELGKSKLDILKELHWLRYVISLYLSS